MLNVCHLQMGSGVKVRKYISAAFSRTMATMGDRSIPPTVGNMRRNGARTGSAIDAAIALTGLCVCGAIQLMTILIRIAKKNRFKLKIQSSKRDEIAMTNVGAMRWVINNKTSTMRYCIA